MPSSARKKKRHPRCCPTPAPWATRRPSPTLPITRGPTRTTLFPYTTLFRSHLESGDDTVILEGEVELARDADALKQYADAYEQKYSHRPNVGGAYVLRPRSEEHTSELQSRLHLVCRLLLEKRNVTRDVAQHQRHGQPVVPVPLFRSHADRPVLHSFPTRRSSDLT